MESRTTKTSVRREPKQHRSRETVRAVVEAVRRVLNRQGAEALTTNHIAEAAGVSIGSLYQYFPNKQSIFAALHEQHVDEVRRLMQDVSTDCTTAPLETFTEQLVERLAHVHAEDAELHEVVSIAVPGSVEGFRSALRATFSRVLSPATQDRYTVDQSERMLFVLPQMVEALVHGVTQQERGTARARAKDEAIRTVALYLNSYRGGHLGRS